MTSQGFSDVEELAALIKQRNAIDREIARIICRPATPGHIGEFVASRIFGIELERSATTAGHDGCFSEGSLVGKTVNIKAYGKRENILDINLAHVPDFYLVLTGPKTTQMTSRGTTRPWVVEDVFLFDARALIDMLRARGTRIGIATSVPSAEWDKARIVPPTETSVPELPEMATHLLSLFAANGTSNE